MSPARLAVAAALLLASAPGAARAADDADRDAAIFGADDAERDEAIFGADDADRDQAIFGAADAARDAAIFGAEDGDRDAAVFGGDDDRDDAIFGEAPSDEPTRLPEGRGLLSGDEIDRRLGRAADKLQIGGLLYLRARWTGYEDQPAEQGPLDSPNLFDVYLDARPNDDLRVFARGRLTHRFAAPGTGPIPVPVPGVQTGSGAATESDLDQLWLKFDVEDRLFVTLGRQPIKWGTGRFWNPTDFLNPTVRNPLAVFDERLGIGAVKLHLPFEASGWNLYALATFDEATTAEGVGGAFRIEKLFGDLEVSLSTALRQGDPLRLGADLSFPLWEFDLRAEAALVHGDDGLYWSGVPDWRASNPFDGLSLESRKEEWIPQAVVGAEVAIRYSDEDSLTIGAEYFYNGAGYDDPRIYPLLVATGSFRPLYLGRHYAALYATAVGPGRWNDTTLIASLLGNLSDRSFFGRFNWRVRLLTYLNLDTWVGYHFGDPGEFRLGMELPGISGLDEAEWERIGVPATLRDLLARGATIPPPTLELGAGLSLRF